MWYIITINQDGQQRKIVSNWQGVIAFLKLNLLADESAAIVDYVVESFTAGNPLVFLQSPNGDWFEIYCKALEPSALTEDYPVVVNPFRQLVNVLSAIL